jgi:microsomal dipeptidase-like Zn-dependent dipeptidase
MSNQATRIFDLHTHPSLKIYYLPWLTRTFHTAPYYSGNHFNPFEFRTHYDNLDKSPIKVLFNAHYVIEQRFLKNGFSNVAKSAFWAMFPAYYALLRFADPWKTLLKMIKTLNVSAQQTNRMVSKDSGHKMRICTSWQQIEALADNEIGLVHAIEGSHAIGSGLEKLPREQLMAETRKRLQILKKLGVACIGPSHFDDNPYSPQAEATEIIGKMVDGKLMSVRDTSIVQMRRAEWEWDDKDHAADDFYNELFRQGFVVDLSHSQDTARFKVYDIAEKWQRPLIVSHAGLKHFFNHEYNISDEELRRIHRLGGVVGLILSKRWLVDPETRYYSGNDGLKDLMNCMLHMRDVTGDISVIAIGTDFDGMTHPFSDCFKPSQLDRVAHAMKAHFTADEVDQILFRNAMRVVKAAWITDESN